MNHLFKIIAILFCADLAMAQVCFYEHINYEGQSFCVGGNQQINALNGFWNDRISSVSVPMNSSTRVCEHAGFGGRCLQMNQPINDLRNYSFNDLISSLSVSQGGLVPGPQPSPNGQSCFFEEPNFQGRRFCLSAGQGYPEFNNTSFGISSVRVHPAHRVIMCQAPFQKGYCQEFQGANPYLNGSLDNRVRYLAVEENYYNPPPPPPPPVQKEACFYTDYHFVGQMFCIRQGNEVSNLNQLGYNDRFNSVRIPWNTSVYVCDNAYFQGPCTNLSGDIASLATYAMNNRISSIRY